MRPCAAMYVRNLMDRSRLIAVVDRAITIAQGHSCADQIASAPHRHAVTRLLTATKVMWTVVAAAPASVQLARNASLTQTASQVRVMQNQRHASLQLAKTSDTMAMKKTLIVVAAVGLAVMVRVAVRTLTAAQSDALAAAVKRQAAPTQ